MVTHKFGQLIAPTAEQIQDANKDWGCNCGPTALAFALQKDLETVRKAVFEVGFYEKRYMNPTMMKRAIEILGATFCNVKCPVRNSGGGLDVEPMFPLSEYMSELSFVRVQWTGPWTQPGVNPRAAYGFTHWCVTWTERNVPLVFDCNSGITGLSEWENETVPRIAETIPRADGNWFPTHIWRVVK